MLFFWDDFAFEPVTWRTGRLIDDLGRHDSRFEAEFSTAHGIVRIPGDIVVFAFPAIYFHVSLTFLIDFG